MDIPSAHSTDPPAVVDGASAREPEAGVLTPARDIRRFCRQFAAGDVIFEQGSPGRCMYVVVDGEVSIVGGADDARRVLNVVGVGESFGEIALLEDGVRIAGAVAASTPTVLVEIDKARFVYLVGQQPAFALTVMRGMARRMEGHSK
ncbi:MAG: cyclic nucleotide-binding domain-containing protein [Burkholderiaceae bacterium]